MEILLLGPVEARLHGRHINMGVRKQRLVLAVLALEVNRHLPTGRLVELLWPQDPPATARGMIHTHISGLRRVLTRTGVSQEEICLVSEGSGYVLRCDPARIDAHRFRSLVSSAQRADDERRVELLDQALALWRGPALAGVAAEEVRARLCRGLDEARLTAMEDLADARLRLGRTGGLIDELLALTAEQPLRSRATAALMRALHANGRTSEALEIYQQTRRRLAEELGLDPAKELQDLQLAILRDDPALAATPDRHAAAHPVPVPHQLPADLTTFTGRTGEVGLLALPESPGPGAPSISVIDGMAGVGKTALAIRVAHHLTDLFIDGQLFIDLRGFTQGVAPLDPIDALGQALWSLGVPGERIPPELGARAALYRTMLAGRSMLVLLDNAADEAQVRPLLPGTPGCAVLITSRRMLAGLDDTHQLSLDVLPVAEAVDLFTRLTGRDPHSSEPNEPAEEIVELCGRLPLAIRIAAARLRARPNWTAAHLAERLRDSGRRLAELDFGERSVTTAIDLSYRQLTAGQRRLFRLLGLHPGTDTDAYAAAALAGTDLKTTGRLLDELVDAHLLDEPGPGRYRFHDLLRSCSARTAAQEETESARRDAITRLLDHYVHAAATAVDRIYPEDPDHRPGLHVPDTPAPPLDDERGAVAWLDAELDNLIAAAGPGNPAHTLDLSAILRRHLGTRGHHSYAYTLHGQALSAARATGDRAREIGALHSLGQVYWRENRYRQAADHFAQALAAAQLIEDRDGELHALIGLGNVHIRQGTHQEAARFYLHALNLVRMGADRAAEIDVLWGLGQVHRLRYRYALAADTFEELLRIARAAGDRDGEVRAHIGLGYILMLEDEFGPAAERFQSALELSRSTGNRMNELRAQNGLGYWHLLQGRHGPAADDFRLALDHARRLDDHHGQFEALLGLGRTSRGADHLGDALAYLKAAVSVATDLGQRSDQARALYTLGLAQTDLGREEDARKHLQQAYDILTELGISRVEDVSTEDLRERLKTL